MHAIRQHEFGGPDVLRLEQVPDPVPAGGQVRIRVAAAGVHRLDGALRAGTGFPPGHEPTLPMTPGREVAGVVDTVGEGVDAAWIGVTVVTHLGPGGSGGYAELAVADVGRLYRLPTGRHAHRRRRDRHRAHGGGRAGPGDIGPDDVAAVTSAAGGMAAVLLQGVRGAGARAVGLAGGADRLEVARGFGAQTVVDYRRNGWLDELVAAEPRLTVVLDGVGGDIGRRLHAALPAGGRMVRFSGDRDDYPGTAEVRDLLGPWMQERLQTFERDSLAAAADGRRVPVVGSTFPLARAADAHRALENRTTTGKVVLVP
ncbi:zinc-binding dehydrogenase [Saccharomonospora sp. CUA-673]|uniref:zinc-binding dehydrogenase n=1 Tax=Saccharomonospora sp. CUA-673 TaxID=1904969 RepID=UPI00210085BC|nr:zinc-binding dehydrogenase [Saccharomonospora sp. CUA-673]